MENCLHIYLAENSTTNFGQDCKVITNLFQYKIHHFFPESLWNSQNLVSLSLENWLKQDWKAFQPPRRRELWQDGQKLSITTIKLQFWLSLMSILTVPNDNFDNPCRQFWQSQMIILTIPNDNFDNPKWQFWQSQVTILTIPNTDIDKFLATILTISNYHFDNP